MLGDLRLTVLAVQDPFPSTPQVQPAAGNRLVAVRYEVVSQSAASQRDPDLPTVELLDAAGAIYRSEHGRSSMVGGSRTPGEITAGAGVETNAVFELPASTTGLRVAFRSRADLAGPVAVVALD